MQQLRIEHKNTIEKKNRREGKGRILALSRNVFRLQNTSDAYYVESESSDDHYYIVKFKPEVFEECSCSCKDSSIRGLKCKHLWGTEFAIKWGIIKDIDKLPSLLTTTSSTNNELGPTNISNEILGHTNLSYDKLGETNNNNNNNTNTSKTIKTLVSSSLSKSLSYKDDEYTF